MDESSLRFEDLSIDDSLLPLPRLLLYSQSPIALQRLVHVKQLAVVCLGLDVVTLATEVLPIVSELSEDEEYVVRQHLTEQVVVVGLGIIIMELCGKEVTVEGVQEIMPKITDQTLPVTMMPEEKDGSKDGSKDESKDGSKECPKMYTGKQAAHEHTQAVAKSVLQATTPLSAHVHANPPPPLPLAPSYRSLILEYVLPLLSKLLADQSPEVRNAASQGIVAISKICNPADLGTHVLTVVLQLAHDDSNEEMRMTAAQLLSSLCTVIGTDLVCQFITPEIISLAEDPVFRVRKAAALHLANICQVRLKRGESKMTLHNLSPPSLFKQRVWLTQYVPHPRLRVRRRRPRGCCLRTSGSRRMTCTAFVRRARSRWLR